MIKNIQSRQIWIYILNYLQYRQNITKRKILIKAKKKKITNPPRFVLRLTIKYYLCLNNILLSTLNSSIIN